MKFAAFIVLSLLAVASAGPAFNKYNQIQSQDATAYQQRQCSTDAKSPTIDILKQWCSSSQMSQKELTASFKKLVQVIKSNPSDQTTEQAVMNECICSGASNQMIEADSQREQQQQQQRNADEKTHHTDAKANELIKDVYMDALISANSRDCTQKLLKIVESQQVDPIRAAYYMTRVAVTDKQSINDAAEIEQFAKSFVEQQQKSSEEPLEGAIHRQKLFATTSLIAKWISQKPSQRQQIEQVAQEVAKTIVERYIKPVSQQEVEQYKQQQQTGEQQQLAKKIAKRNAALKALANIPGHVLKQCQEAEQVLVQLCQNKQELSTVRQSAIECLEQNDKQTDLLKQLAFDQEEPIEVRVAAYRALMTSTYAGEEGKQSQQQQQQQQQAQEIVDQIVKHCENQQNQQQDDQFCLYTISHLDNVRTSQQPEHQAIKETIAANKQHYMQIQVLVKKFKQQLNDVRRSSRNYKLEQEFNQLESGLVLEGDLIYESKQKQQQQQQQQQPQILPKLVRVNMSMPIMGETVNVVEITLRQNQMDEEILGALKMVQSAKFSSQSVSKVVESFKSTVERQQQQQSQQQQQQVEADLTIKVDGCTIVYLCVDDFKTGANAHYGKQQQQHSRNTRSIYTSSSIVDDVIEYLKRQPVAFNRGFNFNINERLAKVLDVDANILAGLRFESRAQGNSDKDFEIVAQMEPRFSFEAVVGPAKVSSKKLLQRLSTKTALGFRLRFKQDQLIDVQVDLPMNTMELFTVESQLVERSPKTTWSYNYLPESIYGPEDIYSSEAAAAAYYGKQLAKRSIYSSNKKSTISQLFTTKSGVQETFETPDEFARATGLNGKLRVSASPRDMSFLVSAVVEKYEPEMKGYRVKVEKSGGRGSQEPKSYMVSFDTPGSRTDRQMQMRLTSQRSQQRTLVKAEIQSARQSAGFTAELVHDQGRQYSIKSELVSRTGQQWRHAAEFGLIQSNSGRLGQTNSQFSYKPYAQIDSTYMKRPVQLQGQVAYSQSPKSVISYELKCPTSGDFVQGKLIFDQRHSGPKMAGTMQQMRRRSMQSPIEMIVSKDLTLTNEFIGQIDKHAVKVHNMLDWDCDKFALQADSHATYKNLRSPAKEQQLSASMKLDQEQQQFVVERKSSHDERKQFVARLVSKVRPTGHQMEAECRYNGRQQSMLAYKHKVDVKQIAKNQYEAQVEVELVDSERQISEKATGRVRLSTERKMKQLQAELASINRQMSAKFQAEYQSVEQHQMQLQVQSRQFQHKTELRNTQRQFYMSSRSEKPQTNQVYYKMQADYQKESPREVKIQLEAPEQRVAVAADLKFAEGKRSSLAIQSKRFASTLEFEVEQSKKYAGFKPFFSNYRMRSNLKDLATKQAYWLDSQLNAAGDSQEASFLRFDSPLYRTDIEFEPRSQEAKFAAYGRSKPSSNQFNSIYSSAPMVESLISQANQKLKLDSGKLWMLRSIMSSPFARAQLKKEAQRALFEYVDRHQNQKHAFEYSPSEERISMDSIVEPSSDYSSSFEPIRMKADVSTRYSRPSTASLQSGWMNADLEAKPFFDTANADDNETYAKINVLSRHPRSTYKKHESELRYNKDDGYKAYMKHQDKSDKRHELRAAAAKNPAKWSRFAYESDKHGKTNWSHHWRNQQKKRAAAAATDDEQTYYSNEFSLTSEGPRDNKWKHETSFQYDEPSRMSEMRRHRRSVATFYNNNDDDDQVDQASYYYKNYFAYPMEYLKQTSARLQSKHFAAGQDEKQKYELDFDYKPQLSYASLNMDMPYDMQHSSQVEIKPSESLYKIQSRLFNRRTNKPTYELFASTKPRQLATAEEEPVYVHSSHPMLERPIDSQSLAYKLFKQPLKLDYSDKYGRSASFDYDHNMESAKRIAGLRQKRASVYYKEGDFEHSSSYDFYPEQLLGKFKPSFYSQYQTQSSPVAIKANTKYGPIVVRAESDYETSQYQLESPLMNAKLQGQRAGGSMKRQLYTIQVDNKQQRVQLSKLLRDMAPKFVRNSKTAKEFARAFDQTRFEQQAEILASVTEQIFKIKAQTKQEGRTELEIEAEWNEPSEKAYVKINGKRMQSQAAIDLARMTGELKFEAEKAFGKHQLRHTTRLVPTSDKFYYLESMTTAGRESRPVFKMTGKVSAKVFEPEHLFSSRRSQKYSSRGSHADHLSTFEAVIYEPKEIHVSGVFDCENKEVRVNFYDEQEKKTQTTSIKYDDETETVYASAELRSQHEGQIYAAKAKVNLPGLYQAEECQQQKYFARSGRYQAESCKSEIFYQGNKSHEQYAMQYYPGDVMIVSSPYGKSSVSLAY